MCIMYSCIHVHAHGHNAAAGVQQRSQAAACYTHVACHLAGPGTRRTPALPAAHPPPCLLPLQDFNSPWHAFASMFAYLLAMFDYSVLYGSSNPNAAMVLFMVFEFIMNVMMLNILIAVMTNSFAKVSEGEALRFLRHRAEVGSWGCGGG